jgi:hypothetical protein
MPTFSVQRRSLLPSLSCHDVSEQHGSHINPQSAINMIDVVVCIAGIIGPSFFFFPCS